jgi:uncharacterized protein (DUF58 family)
LTLQELTAKIRQIEIKSRALSNHLFAGEYHTAFKGKGMSFSEVREYNYGDDVRAIDWNVSARFAHPYIKVFEEERELVLMLMIDISNSNLFGTTSKTKRDLATELSATLAFSALKNNDKVGAIFFNNGIQQYIPPKKGKAHILLILRTLLTIQPGASTATNLQLTLQMYNNIAKRKSIVFIISDFICTPFEKQLQLCSRKHDVIGVQLFDGLEVQMPQVGILPMQDLETNTVQWLNTNNAKTRQQYNAQFIQLLQTTKTIFAKANAGYMQMQTNQDYVKTLHNYFSKC